MIVVTSINEYVCYVVFTSFILPLWKSALGYNYTQQPDKRSLRPKKKSNENQNSIIFGLLTATKSAFHIDRKLYFTVTLRHLGQYLFLLLYLS